MAITVNATFENGQLKLQEPVALAEGTALRLTITPVDEDRDPLEGLIGACSSGLKDGAENHDKYIYDAEFVKRRSQPAKKPAKGKRG